MALDANTLIRLAISTQLTTTDGPVTGTIAVADSDKDNVSPGTTTGKLDQMYSGARTVPSDSTPDSIDLNAQNDPGGTACDFARVNFIKITNLSETAGEDLTIGGGANSVFDEIPLPIPPGASFVYRDLADGLPVESGSAGSTDTIQVATAAGTDVPYSITVAGRSV